MSDTIGVFAASLGAGVWFEGPGRKVAWSPAGALSSALAYVTARDVAVHPWDAWPNPGDPRQDVCPPMPMRKAAKRKAPAQSRNAHA